MSGGEILDKRVDWVSVTKEYLSEMRGMFIDRSNRRVYVFPIPCLGLLLWISKEHS